LFIPVAPAAIVAGLVAALLFRAIFETVYEISFGIVSAFLGEVLSVILATLCALVFGLSLGSPFYALETLVKWLVRWGKCRSADWTSAVARVSGVLAGCVCLKTVVRTTLQLPPAAPPRGPYTWLTIGAAGALVLLAICVTADDPIAYLRQTPFCERCQAWFSDWQSAKFCTEMALPLVRALEGSALSADDVRRTEAPPYIEVKLRRCRVCDAGDFQLTVAAVWEEPGETKRIEWLASMLTADRGTYIRDVLFTEVLADTKADSGPAEA
jgi:hypothetical protein